MPFRRALRPVFQLCDLERPERSTRFNGCRCWLRSVASVRTARSRRFHLARHSGHLRDRFHAVHGCSLGTNSKLRQCKTLRSLCGTMHGGLPVFATQSQLPRECGLTLPSSGLAPAAQAWPSFHSGQSLRRLREPLMSHVRLHMKTYPILRADGSMLAFEITSGWVTFRPLFKILRSVQGVTDVRRNYFNDDRLSFQYLGEPCVINEPWGDNSRYWVGPREAAASSLNLASVNQAFQANRGTLARLWSILRGPASGA